MVSLQRGVADGRRMEGKKCKLMCQCGGVGIVMVLERERERKKIVAAEKCGE